MAKKKILIVDDNQIIRRFLSKLLKKEGHDVFTASDGYMALKIIIMEKPDVLFIDRIMPKIGGDLLCQMIRKMPHMDDSYLVIISATLAEMEFDYRKIGADACIAKGPFGQMGKFVLSAVRDSDVFRDRPEEEPKPIMGLGSDGENTVYPRQITRELLSRTGHLESILDGMNVGILELSGRTIIYANKHAEVIFGSPREDIIARDFIELFEPVDRWRIKPLLKFHDRKNSEIRADNPITIKDRLVSVRAFTRKGNVASTIALITDVTSQQCKIFQKFHAEKLNAVSMLTGSIAKTLKKHVREMGQLGETMAGACGDDTSFGMKMKGFASYGRAMKDFSHSISKLADLYGKTCDEYETPIQTGTGMILICDGDILALQFSRLTLEELGYRVEIAKTGESAVSKYRARYGNSYLGFDLVVADSNLPDISPAELTGRLKRIDPEVNVLIIGDIQKDARTVSNGSRRSPVHIQKPFDIRLVSIALRKALNY